MVPFCTHNGTMNLSIKNVPESVLQRLREQARANRRSLQGELLVILEDAVEPRRLTIAEARIQLSRLRLKTPDESVDMVREDRDDRS